MPTSKITPFLWFNDKAEDAMRFYVSVFKHSKVLSVTPGPNGTAMSVTFELDGQRIMGLNAGPQFAFTEAISFVVQCDTQQEIDDFWSKLTDGGKGVECGWLKDRYGLSWQIVPRILPQLLKKDPETSSRVMKALMQMKKLDIAKLQEAFEG